ncbi:MAG: phage tail tape measure protein [Solibacillus sp.]|uniref:phage tail tape measure protein n=1 Tax=Solibacillus sp. TaxID=1909654 RepID=UPI00331496E6
MAKSFEMVLKIGGDVSSSLDTAFKRASGNVDDLKNSAKLVKQEMRQLDRALKSGKITQEQYNESIKDARQQLNRLESKMNTTRNVSQSLSKSFDTTKMVAGIAAVTAAAGAASMAIGSLNVAADFEKGLSGVQAKTMATATEMKGLRDIALELGASTSLSASEVTVAMDELAAKGFEVNQIIGSMPGIIAGAEASGEDLALVSDTVATAINVWGLEAKEASKVADILAMSANVSAAGVDDLAQMFKYAGAPAAALGISLEEVSAAAGIMTDSGLEGSNAGTALRASLLALNNPAKAQEKMMKKLGFSITDNKGNAKSLANMIRDLSKATEHMTDADKVATLAKLVGTEAVSGFLALVEAGPEKIDAMTKSLRDSEGSAAASAAIMKDNFAGAKEELSGAWETMQIQLATPILPVLQKAFVGVSDFISENTDDITRIGSSIANGVEDILAPLGTKKPEYNAAIAMDPDALAQYESALAKSAEFEKMDLGDKLVYMLDTAIDKVENWMSGEGGEALDKVFVKTGEIAGKAWISAFTGAATSAVASVADGNVAGAIGLGAAAYMLGGGALLKGGASVAKWGASKIPKGSKSVVSKPVSLAPAPIMPKTPPVVSAPTVATTPTAVSKVAKPSFIKSASAKKILGATGKVAAKAALPVTITLEAVNIARSDDKVKATGQATGGIAAGLGGAKLGAAIGTAIAPGIGTALGGLIGGFGGYIGGKYASGKVVDSVRKPSASETTVSSTKTPEVAQVNASITKLETQINTTATTVTTFNTDMTTLQGHVTSLNQHMTLLSTTSEMGVGWLTEGLYGIKLASDRVRQALDSYASRINAASIPSAGGRLNYE